MLKSSQPVKKILNHNAKRALERKARRTDWEELLCLISYELELNNVQTQIENMRTDCKASPLKS